MMTRRLFAGCALCATAGFAATAIAAEGAPKSSDAPKNVGVARRVLQQTDGPIDGFVTILTEIAIAPGTVGAWHTHPGIESAYFVEGGGELMIKGQPNRMMQPGDGVQIPIQMPHAFRNGDKPTKIVATHVVQKSRPLASPAAPG